MNATYQATFEVLNDFFNASKDLNSFNNNIANHLLRILNMQGIITEDSAFENALKDFYSSKGLSATFDIKKQTIQIHYTITNHNDNALVFFLTIWIKNQFKNYKKLDEKILNAIITHAKQNLNIDDELLFKDIVRSAIKKSFNLDIRDSLFFKNLEVYIKKFDYNFSQINKELRNIKKLDSSQLLTPTDKSNIVFMLKSNNTKDLLQECTQEVLQKISLFPLPLEIESSFYDQFLYNITHKFRTQIGKILEDKIPSIKQTCFAEDFIREHLLSIFISLAKQMIHYYFNSQLYSSFIQTYEKQLLLHLPKQDVDYLNATITDYFKIQDKIQAINYTMHHVVQQIQKNDKKIFDLQQQSTKTDTELQELNKSYEINKARLKSNTLTSNEQEAINHNLSRLINEQKVVLSKLENLTEQVEELRNNNLKLNEEIKVHQTQNQDLEINMFAKTQNFNTICNNFAKYLIEHKNEI